MKIEDVITAIITLDYEAVEAVTAAGFDFNQSIPGKRPLVEAAQPAEDERMLRLLWSAGAKPSTPWLEQVFAAFERKEISPLLQNKRTNEANVSPVDLAEDIAASHLEFEPRVLVFNGSESSITIPIRPFRLDGNRVDTTIQLDTVGLPEILEEIENQRFDYPVNPAEEYIDGSVYLRNVHNQVDVTSIKFGPLSAGGQRISATIDFNFLLDAIDLQSELIVREVNLKIEQPD